MRPAGFSNPEFARLADLAHLLAGLVFPANRQPSAEAGMRRAMATLRISDPAALLGAAQTPGPARDVVLGELTTGETYFFRDAAQLDVPLIEILGARAESSDESRPLRAWSAGCASGEEPYTIAILLRELGWIHPAHIIGTDVAVPRLEAARRARYTRWALRGVSEERVAKWFTRRGGQFDLDPQVRDSVAFSVLNLVRDDYTSAKRGAEGFDLVLCRNVMIYFDLDTAARIATGLLDSLAPDGWLVLGASDPPLAQLVACEPVMTSAGIAYRRAGRPGAQARMTYRPTEPPRTASDTAAPPRLRPAATPLVVRVVAQRREEPVSVDAGARLSADAEIREAYTRADYPAAECMAIEAIAARADGQDTLPLWTLYIRAVANQGRLHEAGELCARALESHPLAAELHYLHATLLAEAGWQADAAIAARRSIYLDRTLVMGHLLLGDALTRTGHERGARIAFENAVALLANAEADAPVAAADGVSASRLRQVAELRLRGLTVASRR